MPREKFLLIFVVCIISLALRGKLDNGILWFFFLSFFKNINHFGDNVKVRVLIVICRQNAVAQLVVCTKDANKLPFCFRFDLRWLEVWARKKVTWLHLPDWDIIIYCGRKQCKEKSQLIVNFRCHLVLSLCDIYAIATFVQLRH